MNTETEREIEQAFVEAHQPRRRGRPPNSLLRDIEYGCDYFWAHYGKLHGVTEFGKFNAFGGLTKHAHDTDT